MRRNQYAAIMVVLAAAMAGTLAVMLFGPFVNFTTPPTYIIRQDMGSGPPAVRPQFLPPRVQDAPEDLREWVLEGQRLINQTKKYAASYVGADLTCAHCHFHAGVTDGGRNGGLSLVGAAARYPRYVPNHGTMEDLPARINGCFQRSMNGKKLPPDSKEMKAIVAYLQWISKGIPIYAEIDWLKPINLASDHRPDASAGEQVYITRCSICHGSHGQGTEIAPPVCGPRSFNTGAGLHRVGKFAAFAHLNMPRYNPILSVEEALDVSAYINAQPRPKHKPE